MALVLHGFATQVQALQFEWAWQHPERSTAARGAVVAMSKAQRMGAKGKVWLPLQSAVSHAHTCNGSIVRMLDRIS